MSWSFGLRGCDLLFADSTEARETGLQLEGCDCRYCSCFFEHAFKDSRERLHGEKTKTHAGGVMAGFKIWKRPWFGGSNSYLSPVSHTRQKSSACGEVHRAGQPVHNPEPMKILGLFFEPRGRIRAVVLCVTKRLPHTPRQIGVVVSSTDSPRWACALPFDSHPCSEIAAPTSWRILPLRLGSLCGRDFR